MAVINRFARRSLTEHPFSGHAQSPASLTPRGARARFRADAGPDARRAARRRDDGAETRFEDGAAARRAL
jgi:hypothetical protein